MLPDDGSLANPVHLLGSATGTTYQRAIPPILDDPASTPCRLFVPPVIAGAPEVAAAIRRAVGAARSETR